MAVVLPIIGAFEAVAAAGSIAGALTASVGSFLSVAGGVLAGVGALTGQKDLLRLGGLMSLGGGIAGAMGSASGAAAGEAAGEIAGEGMKVAQSGFDTVRAATDAANSSALGTPSAGLVEGAAGTGIVPPQVDGAWWQPSGPPILQRTALGRAAEAAGPGQGLLARAGAGAGLGSNILDPVAKAGQSMSGDQLNALLGNAWDKTKQLAAGAGQFVKDNKELVSLAGGVVQGMYGPQAEQLDLQKSILARRRANMNNQIRLGPQPTPMPVNGRV